MIEIRVQKKEGFWKPKMKRVWTARLCFRDVAQEILARGELGADLSGVIEVTAISYWDYGVDHNGVYYRARPLSVLRDVQYRYGAFEG